jgi:hypothetical protein
MALKSIDPDVSTMTMKSGFTVVVCASAVATAQSRPIDASHLTRSMSHLSRNPDLSYPQIEGSGLTT